MDRDNRQEKIEKFLKNTLEGKELINFKQALLTDEELAMDVEISKDIEIALDDVFFEKDLTTKLDSLGKKYLIDDTSKHTTKATKLVAINHKTSKARRIPFYRKPWAIAATILLIVSVAGIFTLKNTNQNIGGSQDIFANYYETYPSSQMTRGDNTLDANQKKAINFYQKGDYKKAIPLLIEQTIVQPNDTPTKILLANSYLNTSALEIDKAIEILRPLAEGMPNLYQETAHWYLALAFIKKGKVALAKPLLKALAAKKVGKYPKLAQEVLDQL